MAYYLDGPSLTTATGIYTDVDLTICAPDGLYSNGIIYRELVNCVLGPIQECPNCGAVCSDSDFGSCKNEPRKYNLQIDLGNDSSSTGAVIIQFNTTNKVQGIIANYDGINYNKLSSAIYGVLQAPANLPTYIGMTSSDCGVVSGSPHILPNYNWDVSGPGYVYDGTTSAVSVLPTQMKTTALSPGNSVMVIPKPTPLPAKLNITVFAPCEDCFSLIVLCPRTLYPTTTSQVGISSESVCGLSQNLTYYNAPVNGNGTTLGLFDYIFLDPNGEIPATDGYYYSPSMLPSGYEWFLVSNGVIVQMGNCSWRNYIIRRCATGEDFTALSSIPLSIGNLVSVSEIAYTGCTFNVVGFTNQPPALTVDGLSPYESCSDICSLYSVNNMSASTQYGAYVDCSGVFTTFTIAPNTIDYICARSESITIDGSPGGVVVQVNDCNCPS